MMATRKWALLCIIAAMLGIFAFATWANMYRANEPINASGRG